MTPRSIAHYSFDEINEMWDLLVTPPKGGKGVPQTMGSQKELSG